MDLKVELAKFVQENKLESASISTCLGRLKELTIRPANQRQYLHLKGHFEINSLSGTFANQGQYNHIHISVSYSTGRCFGGHLVKGCIIHTTSEIVILNNRATIYTQIKDKETSFYELEIIKL